MKPLNERVREFLDFIFVVPLAIFPIAFLYGRNIEYASFKDVLSTIGSICLIAFSCYAVFILITKNSWVAIVLTDILVVYFTNYSVLENAVRSYFYNAKVWHITEVVLFILANLLIISKRLSKGDVLKRFVIMIALVFAGLIFFNLFMAAPAISERLKSAYYGIQSNRKFSNRVVANNSSVKRKPNFYFIVFDEFSPSRTLKTFFNYDATVFENDLNSRGFTVSHSSKNTSHRTAVITANLLNLDYVVTPKVNVISEAYKKRQNSKLVELFKENGYKTYTIERNLSSDWYIRNADIRITSDGDSLTNFRMLFYSQTIFKYFVKTGQKDKEIRQAISEIDMISGNQIEPKFVFAHILSPHYPYVFGTKVLKNKDVEIGKDEKMAYLEDYLFIQGEIEQLTEQIIKRDPTCTILIQSDHGYRYTDVHEMGHDIFNAAYVSGTSLKEIEGLSGVNTLREVVSKSLEIKLPLVQDLDYRSVEDRAYNILEDN